MSIFNSIKSFFVTTESDVQALMVRCWNEVPILEREIAGAALWITNTGLPALTNDIKAITPFVSVLSTAAGHSELSTSMAALNAAMAGVQAFATSASNGPLTADQVVAGYRSLKQASAAAQNVASTAAHIVAYTQPSTVSH